MQNMINHVRDSTSAIKTPEIPRALPVHHVIVIGAWQHFHHLEVTTRFAAEESRLDESFAEIILDGQQLCAGVT